MNQAEIFNELSEWLKTNNRLKLELSLGYKSGGAINMWFHRKRIPDREVDRVLKFIRRGRKADVTGKSDQGENCQTTSDLDVRS